MPIQKSFVTKIFDQDGTTLRSILTSDPVLSGSGMYLKNKVPTFSSRINGGQGECVLDLKTRFDSFSEGTVVDYLNVVKIYAVTVNTTVSPATQTATHIYTGFVSRYEPYIQEGGDEGVRVTCLGLVSLLTRSYYDSAGSFTVARGPEDPTLTAKNIIDRYNAVFGGSLLSYDVSSIPATVGASITYTFTDQKWFDALQKTVELAGTGWWWRVGEDGKLYMKAKPSSATWTFTIGRDVTHLQVTKNSEGVINDVYVRRSGGTETTYSDGTSQATYGTGSPATGKYSEIITDASIQDATTANQRGNKAIADKKDAKISARVTINTNFGSFDAVRCGDTCMVKNLASSTLFSSNMQIVSIDYQGTTQTLELEQITSDFGTALDGFVNG